MVLAAEGDRLDGPRALFLRRMLDRIGVLAQLAPVGPGPDEDVLQAHVQHLAQPGVDVGKARRKAGQLLADALDGLPLHGFGGRLPALIALARLDVLAEQEQVAQRRHRSVSESARPECGGPGTVTRAVPRSAVQRSPRP